MEEHMGHRIIRLRKAMGLNQKQAAAKIGLTSCQTLGCLYMDADCIIGEMYEPFTNYDLIRNMSVEEMAIFLATETIRPIINHFETEEKAKEFFIDVVAARNLWLESEATE